MKVRAFNVLPKLPKALDPLRDIAYNIWFSWNWEAVQLFIRMDVEYWDKTYQNPALMLGVVPQERFEELARDEGFLATMNRVHAQFRAYMDCADLVQQDLSERRPAGRSPISPPSSELTSACRFTPAASASSPATT